MGESLFNDYYDDEKEFSFINDCEGWDLCGNCHNYIVRGRCALDNHEVDYDDTCTYNLKKEDRND